MQDKFKETVDKIIEHNKLSHAYLIETNNLEDYKEYIDYFIKQIVKMYTKNDEEYKDICLQIDNNDFINLKIIEADSWIRKEVISMLKKDYSKKSYLDYPEIYVIDDAANLTSATANSLLKFLEEPEEGIIAILVTTNRYNIIDTIRSRTQILELVNDKEIVISKEVEELIGLIENPSNIVNYEKILNIMPDRVQAKEFLKQVEEYYYNQINNNYFEKYIKYVLIIEEAIERIDYNVNYKLWLDALLVKIMEV